MYFHTLFTLRANVDELNLHIDSTQRELKRVVGTKQVGDNGRYAIVLVPLGSAVVVSSGTPATISFKADGFNHRHILMGKAGLYSA